MGATEGYTKLLPMDIPGWQEPFWDSLRAHQVRVQRCSTCGTYRYQPKEVCARCQSRAAQWSPISGRGTVYTYTVIRRAPTPAYEAGLPYAIVHVTMEENFRMAATMRGMDPDAVRIGLPVRLAYDDVTTEWTLFVFEPERRRPMES